MRTIVWTLLGAAVFACQGCGLGSRGTFEYVPVAEPQTRHVEQAISTYTSPIPLAEPESMRVPIEPNVTTTAVPGPTVAEPTGSGTKAAPDASSVPTKLVRGNPGTLKIALTFDDGPHPGFTEELIRVLKELNVRATFFFIGRNVDANPELAKKAFDAGMEIANHTYSHSRLPLLSDTDVKSELLGGALAIEKATGFKPRFYRPPGGEYDTRIAEITRQLGLTMVLWTSDAGDYTTPIGNPAPDTIFQKVMRYAGPGGIVIMHDPMPSTLKALPLIVTTLRARGYQFVTVSEMAADPKCVTVGGPRIEPRHAAAVQLLSDQGRYPTPNSTEAKNASSEQRAKGTAAPEGTTDQRTDQRGQGVKVSEVQDPGAEGRQGVGTQGPQESGRQGRLR